MRVLQLLPTLAYGDAVGNDALALKDAIRGMGYETELYAWEFGAGIRPDQAKKFDEFPDTTAEDVILYHLSTGAELNLRLPEIPGRKIIRYHNITPGRFFAGYDDASKKRCDEGYKEAAFLADKVDYVLAVSDYNRQDLVRMGYTCPMDILPILIPFSDYEKKPDRKIMRDYANDPFTRILFNGRVAPNKRHEDVIRAFCAYQRHYNRDSQLIFVGNYRAMPGYYHELKKLIKDLGVKDVKFTGHSNFQTVLAYYHLADLFLCMSEHEGFCVPLAESMFFNIPIVAYDSSAIADTLGGSGFLLKEKDPYETAGVMNRILTDDGLRRQIIDYQRERLKDFSHEVILERFQTYLKRFVEG